MSLLLPELLKTELFLKKNVITLDFLTIKHCLLMPKACRSLQFACGDCEEGRKVSASSQKIPTETLG